MHGGNVQILAPHYGFGIEQVIDFSVNLNPLGSPPEAQEIFKESWKELSQYPDPNSTRLRAALSEWHDVSPDNLIAGNGASELIYWVTRIFSPPKALILAPTFSEYSRAVVSAGGAVAYKIAKEENEFAHLLTEESNDGQSQFNIVFICNPNNPTGTLFSKSCLEKWMEQCLHKYPKTLFVIDESFLPFVGEEEKYSLIPQTTRTDSIIVLRSLTKIFSVPALRLGYAVSHLNMIQRLQQLMPPWNVNIFAQRFGERIFSYAQFIKQSVAYLQSVRDDLARQLRNLPGIKLFDSAANFFLIKLQPEQISASKLTDQLAQRGILVRPCDDFVGLEKERFIRIAIRKQEENNYLVKVLKELLDHAL